MQKYLGDDDLFVYLRMLRSSDSRLFLIVEGESDIRALERQLSVRDCTIISGYSRRVVLDAMRRLEKDDPDGCVGFVDRDFGKFSGETLPENVVTTTLYDRESDFLLLIGLIDDFVTAAYRQETAKEFMAATSHASIRDMAVDIAYTIGRVRWSSLSNGIRLRLYRFPVSVVLEWPATVEEVDVIKLAIQRTKDCDVDVFQMMSISSEPRGATAQDLCCGHDIVSALSASSRWWSNRNIGIAEIENFLTGAIRRDVLEGLEWFQALDQWAVERGRRIWKSAA